MDFALTQEQQDVQTLARKILSELVTPESLGQYDDYCNPRFDKHLWQQLARAGLLGIAIEECYGGTDLGFTALALFIEEIGRSIAPVPAISHLVSAALAVQVFGSDEQKQRWLPASVSGEKLLTAALMEPHNENPCTPMLTQATAEKQGFRVSGVKTCVPFADTAAFVLMVAKTDSGVAVLMVDPTASGIEITPIQVSTFEPQFQLRMNNVLVAANDVLVYANDGEQAMRWISERTLASVCAHQLGACDEAMRMTASYTSQREQFGVPVATFQAVGHRAANCFIDVECLRLNTYQAVSRLDSGSDGSDEVTIAKIWANDCGHRVSYASQHLHGGMGIDRDYPLWRYCLWMRHNEMMLGSSSALLMHLGQCIAEGKSLLS